MGSAEPVRVLFFTGDGLGPDHIELALNPMPAIDPISAPASLGLMIAHAADSPCHFVMEGGFMLDRAAVEQLHAQLGAWLEASRG